MTSSRKPGFVLPVAVTLAVLLGLYVGAYYAMVRPLGPVPFYSIGDPNDPRWYNETAPGIVHGPHLGWMRFFSPIHWLDRRLRPHVWEPK
jgi:hypothetical protein